MSPTAMADALAREVNERLHQSFGVEPCTNACTHYLDPLGEWSALGIANVMRRKAEDRYVR